MPGTSQRPLVIAPSLLAADFSKLGEEARVVEQDMQLLIHRRPARDDTHPDLRPAPVGVGGSSPAGRCILSYSPSAHCTSGVGGTFNSYCADRMRSYKPLDIHVG